MAGMTGSQIISEAMAEAIAENIRGASTDKVLWLAGLNETFARSAEKRIKAIFKLMDLWTKRQAQMKADNIKPTDTEWVDAKKIHYELVSTIQVFMTRMFETAIKAAEEAVD